MILCILAAFAMLVENLFFGISPGKNTDKDKVEPERETREGEIINTTRLGDKILGYGGPVAL